MAKIPGASTIVVTTEGKKNPKREGTKAYERFVLYKDGMTIKEYMEAGGQAGDVKYDSDHEYIVVTIVADPEPVAEAPVADDAPVADAVDEAITEGETSGLTEQAEALAAVS